MKRKNKKNVSIKRLIISDLLFIICIAMLMYPIISDIWNSYNGSHMEADYEELVGELSNEEYDDILKEANEYNKKLVNQDNSRFSQTDEEKKEYNSLLQIEGTDVMGYLDAPSIGVEHVPIYHGTSNTVLQSGIGHFEGSSLPVGGASTHSVLSGHTGMANLKMFSDLNRIKKGAKFQITILGEVLTYEVDRIKIVYPDDLSYLNIEEGKDYCTLVTCIPIGINSQRLCVRGHRVKTVEVKSEEKDNGGIFNWLLNFWDYITTRFSAYELIMAAVALLIMILFIVPDLKYYIRRMKKG